MAKRRSKVKVQASGADAGLIVQFEAGLDHLYSGRWATAEKVFRKVASSGGSLAERCRRFIQVCELRRSKDEPGPQDAYLSAVVAKNEGDLDEAMEYCNRGGLKGRDQRFAYLAATIEAVRGNTAEASRLLERAIEMDGKNRVHAFWDPDFSEVREDPELSALFEAE